MSRIFKARDEALVRVVVVKVPAPEVAEGVSAEGFAGEIRHAAGPQISQVAPVLTASVTSDGLSHFTMPYVRSDPLRARLTRARMPFPEAVVILHDDARALAYAHRQGVLHRDPKPENVLRTEGTSVLADFGIAKALQASCTNAPDGAAAVAATLTQQGISLGTPAYMAHEQVPRDAAADHRADLCLAGVHSVASFVAHPRLRLDSSVRAIIHRFVRRTCHVSLE